MLVAFDKETGKEVWQSLKTPGEGNAGYSPPTLIDAGGVKQVAIWYPGKLASVNPDDGKKYWDVELKPAYGMSIMGPRQSGDYLFCAGIGYACVVVKLDRDRPGAKEVWRGTQENKLGAIPVTMPPVIANGVIYGVDQPGFLRAVQLETGKMLWETRSRVTGKDETRIRGRSVPVTASSSRTASVTSSTRRLVT